MGTLFCVRFSVEAIRLAYVTKTFSFNRFTRRCSLTLALALFLLLLAVRVKMWLRFWSWNASQQALVFLPFPQRKKKTNKHILQTAVNHKPVGLKGAGKNLLHIFSFEKAIIVRMQGEKKKNGRKTFNCRTEYSERRVKTTIVL